MNIREAADGDAPSLAGLLGQLGYPADARDLPRRLTRLAERGTAVAFVAEMEGRVVGVTTAHAFASIHAERDVAWLTTLVVDEKARGQGIGSTLVTRAEAWAIQHGAPRISLTSALHRKHAHDFYKTRNYEHTGVRLTKIFADQR